MAEGGSVNQMMERVSFSTKISLILKATSDDEGPIPGYLYKKINNITLESDGYCESTLEYLVDRLNKDSCHVKLKVLKLMKHIVQNGHTNFRLGLIKSAYGINQAKKFSGPPDPLRGNDPYLTVRNAAKELSEILFDVDDKLTSSPDIKKPQQIPVVGLGPSSHTKSSKMDGFGSSPNRQQKSFGEKLMQNISDIAESLSETPEDHQMAVLSALEKPDNYQPPVKYQRDISSVTCITQKAHKPVTVQKHIPGRAGAGWDDEDDSEEEYMQEKSLSSSRKSNGSTEITNRLEESSLEDWQNEENLVKSTLESTQSMLLTNREISEFIRDCSQCNCDRIVEILNRKLESSDQKILMKSLLLIENLLRTDLLSIDHIITSAHQNLLSVYTKKTGPTSIKSKKILRILEKLANVAIIPETSSSHGQMDSENHLKNSSQKELILDMSPLSVTVNDSKEQVTGD